MSGAWEVQTAACCNTAHKRIAGLADRPGRGSSTKRAEMKVHAPARAGRSSLRRRLAAAATSPAASSWQMSSSACGGKERGRKEG